MLKSVYFSSSWDRYTPCEATWLSRSLPFCLLPHSCCCPPPRNAGVPQGPTSTFFPSLRVCLDNLIFYMAFTTAWMCIDDFQIVPTEVPSTCFFFFFPLLSYLKSFWIDTTFSESKSRRYEGFAKILRPFLGLYVPSSYLHRRAVWFLMTPSSLELFCVCVCVYVYIHAWSTHTCLHLAFVLLNNLINKFIYGRISITFNEYYVHETVRGLCGEKCIFFKHFGPQISFFESIL